MKPERRMLTNDCQYHFIITIKEQPQTKSTTTNEQLPTILISTPTAHHYAGKLLTLLILQNIPW